MSAAGRKLVKFLELVRAGTDKDEAMEMCQHLPKEKRTPKKTPKTPKNIPTDPNDPNATPKSYKRKKYSGAGDAGANGEGGGGASGGGIKIKIGPKSKLAKLQGKLSRDVSFFFIKTTV
jgi:hypothetical protein